VALGLWGKQSRWLLEDQVQSAILRSVNVSWFPIVARSFKLVFALSVRTQLSTLTIEQSALASNGLT